MDLIYTNKNKEDMGIIQDFSLDMAYGSDENNFELQKFFSNDELENGSFIYVDNTEYGGIIDAVKDDTSSDNITYTGRTITGILNSKIIIPDTATGYFAVEGYANKIIKELVDRCELSNIVLVNETVGNDIYIPYYEFSYDYLYDGLRKMLSSFSAKLKFKFSGSKILLWAENIVDYSTDEEFDDSQISFTAAKIYNSVNHLICVGSDDLLNNYCIHLFIDVDGVLQPYAITNAPMQDSDYILDESGKIFENDEEYCRLLKVDSISSIENYILLNEIPLDWADNYYKYYTQEISDTGEISYKEIEKSTQNNYFALQNKPNEWESTWQNYFVMNSDGEFISASDKDWSVYTVLTSKPTNWDLLYSQYYVQKINYTEVAASDVDKDRTDYYHNNGTDYIPLGAYSHDNPYWDSQLYVKKISYEQASSQSKETYAQIDKKPSTWSKDYSKYYFRQTTNPITYATYSQATSTAYIRAKNKPKTWGRDYSLYYMLVTDGVTTDYQQCSSVTYNGYALQKNKPNDWDNNFLNYFVLKNGKYTKIEDIPRYYNPWLAGAIVPKWQKNKFYSSVQKSKAPAWDKTQKYFKKIQKTVAPAFQKNNTFVKISIVQPPEFTSGKFYSREVKTVVDFKANEFYEERENIVPIVFSSGMYYNKVIDRYKNLVEQGIEKLNEIYSDDELNISISATQEYDIGDIVEGVDNKLGITARQPIVKKIVVLNKYGAEVEYNVGEENL
jgi:hypothetical protein